LDGHYASAKVGTIYCTALVFTESSKEIYSECPADAKLDFSRVVAIKTDGSWDNADIEKLMLRGSNLPKDVLVRACAQDSVDLDAFYKQIPFDRLEVFTSDSSHDDVKIQRPYKFGGWSVPGGAENVPCKVKFPNAKIGTVTLSTRNHRPWIQVFTDKLGIHAKECHLNTVMVGSFDDPAMTDNYVDDANGTFKKLNNIDRVIVDKID
jgi:hypothetical protein